MTPDTIGRYQIVRELGRGAMGVVYEARDPNIGRVVALKTIRLDATNANQAEEITQRFRNEARMAGSLNFPNIVTVHDAGEQDGLLYIAMEFIEGQTLQALLAQRRTLPVREAIGIVRQVCSALDFAHAKGVIHRDVKPGNVMLASHGLVKITDFGIARAGEAMTMTGQVLGTPNYMSPEQVRGKPLDGRSDLFSVGVMLYEMLTGERPFEGQNITTIMYKIVHERAIPPSEIDSSIPRALSAIVEKSLAKSPDERYQTGADLVNALENFGTGATSAYTAPTTAVTANVPTTAPTSTPTLPPPAPRSWTPWRIALSGIRVLAFVVLISLLVHYYRREPSPSQAITSPPSQTQTATAAPAQPPVPAAPATPTDNSAAHASHPAKAPEVVQLQPSPSRPAADVAQMQVNSSPPGAAVLLDGNPTGKTTPAELKVPKGEHTVSVKMEGFQPSSAKFKVHGGEELEFRPTLNVSMTGVPAIPNISIPKVDMSGLNKQIQDMVAQRRAEAEKNGADWQTWAQMGNMHGPHIMVASKPPGAHIWVDGADTGKSTPAMLDSTPGKHHVRVELEDFLPQEKDVTVGDDKPGAASFHLQVKKDPDQ